MSALRTQHDVAPRPIWTTLLALSTITLFLVGGCPTDSDSDGIPDVLDGCPLDASKIAPGPCGCGVREVDTDGDGTPDCVDACPEDPNKTAPGNCGCGIPDTPGCGAVVDSDGDGTPDSEDGCPNDPNKTEPGECGCGNPETPGCGAVVDTDGDGTPDSEDGCPNDPNKNEPGECGCGNPETPGCGSPDDGDADGIPDDEDNCPDTPNPGQEDTDGDGFGDACEECGDARLVAYYPFDEDVRDATGNGNDGEAHGGVSYTSGVDGQAVLLDGATGYVDLIEETNLDGFDTVTIALWVKPDGDLTSGTARQDILYKGRSTQNGASYDLNYGDRDGALTTHTHSTNWFDESMIAYESDFDAGEWAHIALTYDGNSSLHLYVNGAPVGIEVDSGMNGSLFDNADALTLGRRPGGRYYFDGAIDELRIYDCELSQSQITELCDCNDPQPPSNRLLVRQGHIRNRYQGDNWSQMTAVINAGFPQGAVVVTTLATVDAAQYDALWVDLGATTASLTAAEIAVVEGFIDSGKRVVLIGENRDWSGWTSQILGIVGGTYTGSEMTMFTANAELSHALTQGAPTIRTEQVGLSSGGTSLYSIDFISLWGASSNVLCVLDTDVFDDELIDAANNHRFAENVAAWLTGGGD